MEALQDHRQSILVLPFPASKHPALRLWQIGFEAISFDAKGVYLIQYSLQQSLGGGCRNTRPLKL
jgi:hypothetical protein